MSFLNPWMLLGLAGISVPIVIHLLNRFRQREVDWGAMELLRRAIVLRSRQVQIEDLLLLLLRCLAVILIALAMARPTLTRTGWFGGDVDVAVTVAIDASYSMDHRPGVEPRFNKAVGRAKEVLHTLEPGAPVTLVLMGDRPRIILRNVGYNAGHVDKILDGIRPLPERLNLERCLEEIALRVEELKAPRRECFLITDAQAVTWGEVSDLSRRSIDRIARSAEVFFIPSGAAGSENVAITAFELSSGQHRRGAMGRYLVEVSNTGKTLQQDVPVSLTLDDETVDQRIIEVLQPGSKLAVPLFARFDRPGPARLIAQLRPDALTVDNVRHAVADIREKISILMIDGDPSDRPYRSETDFISRALLPKSAANSVLQLERAVWPTFPAARLDEFDVVVLANVADIRQTHAERLQAFVRRGGGLIITLGDKIDPKLTNARLLSEKVSLLPAKIGQDFQFRADPGKPAEGWTLEPGSDRRLAYFVSILPKPLVAEARVQRLFVVEPVAGATSILRTEGTERPLLVERTVGHGKVLLLATTADRDWANLAIHPMFPMMLHEAIGRMTGQARRRSYLVGEPLAISLPGSTAGTNVVVRDPDGRESPVQVVSRDGEAIADFHEPTKPGVYEILTGEKTPPILVAVNVDPREAAVASLDAAALQTPLTGLPVRIPADMQGLPEEIRQLRIGKELWRILLTAGLCVLLLEAVLAYVFARRIRADDGLANMDNREALLSGRDAA